MSDYDDGWNEGFDIGASHAKELQTEIARLVAHDKARAASFEVILAENVRLRAEIEGMRFILLEEDWSYAGFCQYRKEVESA